MLAALRQDERTHVSRLGPVKPSAGDVFYLRALLGVCPARSFDELRTFEDRAYSSFQAAAIARGLFANESEAQYALREAVHSLKTPRQLRILFVHLLTNSQVLSQHRCKIFNPWTWNPQTDA